MGGRSGRKEGGLYALPRYWKNGFMAAGIPTFQKNLAAFAEEVSRTVSMVIALLDSPDPSKSLGLSCPEPETGLKVRVLK